MAAGPSVPMEFVGLQAMPAPGSDIFVVKDEVVAKRIADNRALQQANADSKLDAAKEEDQSLGPILIPAVLKTDVAGSIEAVKKAMQELPMDEVKLHVIKSSIGPIVEADVELAILSNSVILAFGLKQAVGTVDEKIAQSGIRVFRRNVVYDLVDDVRTLLTSKLAPRMVVDILGVAEVKELYAIDKKKDTIAVAGCQVNEGVMKRGGTARVIRNGKMIFEGKVASLRSFKQSVNDVKKGNECGLSIIGLDEFKKGDVIQHVHFRNVQRKLGEKM